MTHAGISAGHTETGKVRSHNEDAILLREDEGLWVVADGLGGHAAGDYASTMIVERLGRLRRSDKVFDFVEAIEDVLVQVNVDLRRTALERGVDLIGSTVVLLVRDRDFSLCGWVGDSRAYCFDNGQFRQITRDHTLEAENEATRFGQGLAPPQAGTAALTRAIGAEDQLFLDWVMTENRPGMQFLLCSDGINKEIPDAELDAEYRRNLTPQALVDDLFGLAMSRAARDNISAVVVRFPP